MEHTPENCTASKNKSISQQEPDLLLHRQPWRKTKQAARSQDATALARRLKPWYTDSGTQSQGNGDIPTHTGTWLWPPQYEAAAVFIQDTRVKDLVVFLFPGEGASEQMIQ